MPHKSSLFLRVCFVPLGMHSKHETHLRQGGGVGGGVLQLHYRVLLPESNWGGVTESGGSSEGTFNPLPPPSQQLSYSQIKFQELITSVNVNLTHFEKGSRRNMPLLLKCSIVSTATAGMLDKQWSAQIFSGFIPLHHHHLTRWLTPWPSTMETLQQLLEVGPRQAHLNRGSSGKVQFFIGASHQFCASHLLSWKCWKKQVTV